MIVMRWIEIFHFDFPKFWTVWKVMQTCKVKYFSDTIRNSIQADCIVMSGDSKIIRVHNNIAMYDVSSKCRYRTVDSLCAVFLFDWVVHHILFPVQQLYESRSVSIYRRNNVRKIEKWEFLTPVTRIDPHIRLRYGSWVFFYSSFRRFSY